MDYPARTPEQLGQILRALRLGRSMPQTELATDSGLLQKTISLLERAPERATVETLMRAIAALDADLVIRPRTDGGSPTEPQHGAERGDDW